MSVHYYKTSGRFYIGDADKQWQVVLHAPGGPVSELWSDDEEPDIDDKLPSEVLDLIEERLKSYWINTGREGKLKTVAAMREQIAAADREWVQARIHRARQDLADWESILADMPTASTEKA